MSPSPVAIAIPLHPASVTLFDSQPSSPQGLYIPVHKRKESNSPSSSRSTSPARSISRQTQSTITAPQGPQYTSLLYSRDALIALARSPLSKMQPETREALRDRLPEIVTNRKQRKAIEYRKQVESQRQKAVVLESPKPIKPAPNVAPKLEQAPQRRNRINGRLPESRRRLVTKVDELSWRGRPAFPPLATIAAA